MLPVGFRFNLIIYDFSRSPTHHTHAHHGSMDKKFAFNGYMAIRDERNDGYTDYGGTSGESTYKSKTSKSTGGRWEVTRRITSWNQHGSYSGLMRLRHVKGKYAYGGPYYIRIRSSNHDLGLVRVLTLISCDLYMLGCCAVSALSALRACPQPNQLPLHTYTQPAQLLRPSELVYAPWRTRVQLTCNPNLNRYTVTYPDSILSTSMNRHRPACSTAQRRRLGSRLGIQIGIRARVSTLFLPTLADIPSSPLAPPSVPASSRRAKIAHATCRVRSATYTPPPKQKQNRVDVAPHGCESTHMTPIPIPACVGVSRRLPGV